MVTPNYEKGAASATPLIFCRTTVDYFNKISRPVKQNNIIDYIEKLEKPLITGDADLSELYYKEQGHKYGF